MLAFHIFNWTFLLLLFFWVIENMFVLFNIHALYKFPYVCLRPNKMFIFVFVYDTVCIN